MDFGGLGEVRVVRSTSPLRSPILSFKCAVACVGLRRKNQDDGLLARRAKVPAATRKMSTSPANA